MCQPREHLVRIFCSLMYVRNFFWRDGLVQEFFSYTYTCRIFFQNDPTTFGQVKD